MCYVSSPTFILISASYLPIDLAVYLAVDCNAFCYEATTANIVIANEQYTRRWVNSSRNLPILKGGKQILDDNIITTLTRHGAWGVELVIWGVVLAIPSSNRDKETI